MTPGKLEVTIKISTLPADVETVENGWKLFRVLCGEREVSIRVRPKLWNKIDEASKSFPLWVAAIVGQMGPGTEKGFELLEANIQVFERKAKPVAGAPASTTD